VLRGRDERERPLRRAFGTPERLGTAPPEGFPGLVYNRRAAIPSVAI